MSEQISRAELERIQDKPALYRCGWMDARHGEWHFHASAFPSDEDRQLYEQGFRDYEDYSRSVPDWRKAMKG